MTAEARMFEVKETNYAAFDALLRAAEHLLGEKGEKEDPVSAANLVVRQDGEGVAFPLCLLANKYPIRYNKT
jgi:hypothetical protein